MYHKTKGLKSVLNNLDKDSLQSLLDGSVSIRDFFRKINVRDIGNNRKILYRFIEDNNLCLIKLKENRKGKIENGFFSRLKLENKKIFVRDSKTDRSVIKRRILKDKIIKYKCDICKNNGKWQNKKLVLHLDHINGIPNDHRIENLRFLCPNCHSQTETFGTKNFNSTQWMKTGGIFHKDKEIKAKNKEKHNELIVSRKQLLESRKQDILNTDLNRFGWVKKLSTKWKISHTQVKKWILRNIPEIQFYQRKVKRIQNGCQNSYT